MNTVCSHRPIPRWRFALGIALLSVSFATALRASVYVTCKTTTAATSDGSPGSESLRFTAGPFATMAEARRWCQENGAVDTVFSGSEDGQGSPAGAPAGGQGSGSPDAAEQLGHQLGTALGNQLVNALFGNKSANNGPSQAEFQQGQMQAAAQQLNNTGMWYLRQKDYPSAVHEFQQALDRAPNDQSIAANLALAQQGMGMSQQEILEAARARAAANRPPGAPDNLSGIPDPNGDPSAETSKVGAIGAGPEKPGGAPITAGFGKLYNEPVGAPPIAGEGSGGGPAPALVPGNSTEGQKGDGGLGKLYGAPLDGAAAPAASQPPIVGPDEQLKDAPSDKDSTRGAFGEKVAKPSQTDLGPALSDAKPGDETRASRQAMSAGATAGGDQNFTPLYDGQGAKAAGAVTFSTASAKPGPADLSKSSPTLDAATRQLADLQAKSAALDAEHDKLKQAMFTAHSPAETQAIYSKLNDNNTANLSLKDAINKQTDVVQKLHKTVDTTVDGSTAPATTPAQVAAPAAGSPAAPAASNGN